MSHTPEEYERYAVQRAQWYREIGKDVADFAEIIESEAALVRDNPGHHEPARRHLLPAIHAFRRRYQAFDYAVGQLEQFLQGETTAAAPQEVTNAGK